MANDENQYNLWISAFSNIIKYVLNITSIVNYLLINSHLLSYYYLVDINT